ncbi:MAG: hypothetical protein ACRC68_16130, partial [Clostridium sp.]
MKFIKSNISNSGNEDLLDKSWRSVSDSKNKSYKSKKLFVELILGIIYAFGFGYSLFFLDNLIESIILFLISLIVLFIIIIIPHETLHIIYLKPK